MNERWSNNNHWRQEIIMELCIFACSIAITICLLYKILLYPTEYYNIYYSSLLGLSIVSMILIGLIITTKLKHINKILHSISIDIVGNPEHFLDSIQKILHMESYTIHINSKPNIFQQLPIYISPFHSIIQIVNRYWIIVEKAYYENKKQITRIHLGPYELEGFGEILEINNRLIIEYNY